MRSILQYIINLTKWNQLIIYYSYRYGKINNTYFTINKVPVGFTINLEQKCNMIFMDIEIYGNILQIRIPTKYRPFIHYKKITYHLNDTDIEYMQDILRFDLSRM